MKPGLEYANIQDIPSGVAKKPSALRVEFSRRLRRGLANAVETAEQLPMAELEIRIDVSNAKPILVVKHGDEQLFFQVTRARLKDLKAEYDKAVELCRQVEAAYHGTDA